MSDNNIRSLRTSLILNDINEVKDYKVKEILVDYNNGYDIYFITPEGGRISPTFENKEFIKTALRNHIRGNNQHKVADINNSGFMSSEDKILLVKLEELYQYIIENPFMEIENNVLGYEITNKIHYVIDNDSIILTSFKFRYDGYSFNFNNERITLGKRTSDRVISYAYIEMIKDDTKLGNNKYRAEIKVTSNKDETKDKQVIFIIDRFNDKPFTPMNPYGNIGAEQLTPVEILTVNIVKGEEDANKETHNLHFGVPRLPITENTIVAIDGDGSNFVDMISGTDLDKISTFKLSPTGKMVSKSDSKGIGIPVEFAADKGTIEFMIYVDKDQEIINDTIMDFNNSDYESVFSLRAISTNIDRPDEVSILYHTGKEDVHLCSTCAGFNNYKIVCIDGKLSVYINDRLVREVMVAIPLSKAKLLQVSSLRTAIGSIRISKTDLKECLTTMDIVNGKGSMHPLLPAGHRKVSNDTSYIFNSIKVNYSDVGITPSEEYVWNSKDSVILYKNDGETISGVYNVKDATAKVLGIKSSNSLYVDNINELSLYDNIRIVKFNKNLFKIFKIVNINYEDGSIQVVENYEGDLKSVKIDGSYIYSNIFTKEIIPSIEVVDQSGKVIDISQYPDDEGNVKIELLEPSKSENLFISYLLITDYKNIIPEYDYISKAYMDNVECVEMEMYDKVNIPVKNPKVIHDDKEIEFSSLVGKKAYSKVGCESIYHIDIDLYSELTNVRVLEETIVMNMIDNISLEIKSAHSCKFMMGTLEESILLQPSLVKNTITANFICTDMTIVDGKFRITLNMYDSGEYAFAIEDIKLGINLKKTKPNERIFAKTGSLMLEDMFIVSNDKDNKYIKTLIDTSTDNKFMLSVIRNKKKEDCINDHNVQ